MKHNWEYNRLGEVCQVVRGGSPRPIQDFITDDENGLNWIKIGDVSAGSKYITNTKERIKRDGLSKTRQVFSGDFILSNSMSFGRPYILKIDGCIHDGWLAIKGVENHFIADFLYYYLSASSTYSTFERLAKGSVVSNLNSDIAKNIIVPIPDISSQEKIVRELDKINEIISDCKKAIRTLDSLAQSLFYDYFGDPITNSKGWKICKLGDRFETGSGGTPSKTINEYWENGDIPWIGSNMCQNKIITETDGKFISSLGLENSSAKVLEPNTVLVALVGATIGKVGLLQIPTSTNQNIGFIKPNPTIASPLYLFFVIKNLYSLFINIGNGKFKMANLSFIRNLPIMLPPLSLQKKFTSRIEQIEQQKKDFEETIANMQTLLDSRMDYWFG